MKRALLGLAVVLLTISSSSYATELDLFHRGGWLAAKLTDEFTGASTCVLIKKQQGHSDRELSIFHYLKSLTSDGGYSKSYALVKDNGGKRFIKDPDDIQMLIDGKPVSFANYYGFIEAAKAGLKLTYRSKIKNRGTITRTISLSGFTKAWEAADEICGHVRKALQFLPSYITREHRNILAKWLMQNPQLRLAIDSDINLSEHNIEHRKKNGDPEHYFYSSQDLNADGHLDFVVVVIDLLKEQRESALPPPSIPFTEKRRKTYYNAGVAVFNGPFKENQDPVFYEPVFGKPEGTLLWGIERVCIGPPESRCRRLMPDGTGYKFQNISSIDLYESFQAHFIIEKSQGFQATSEGPVGNKLDKEALGFLANGLSNLSPQWKNWVKKQWRTASPNFYGLYQIEFDSVLDGFILRGAGKYIEPSAIYLILVEKQTHRLVSYKQIAESWADEGVRNDWRSWLIDIDNNGSFEVITRYSQEDSGEKTHSSIESIKWTGSDWVKIQTPVEVMNEYMDD